MRAEFHFLERIEKSEIGGRVVDRIASEDQQSVDDAAVHVADEFGERGDLIDRIYFHGVGVGYGLANVAEPGVPIVGDRVEPWRCGALPR